MTIYLSIPAPAGKVQKNFGRAGSTWRSLKETSNIERSPVFALLHLGKTSNVELTTAARRG
jgi:hypothetical protein